ncbi:MAG: ADP-ribosylglycohydrolase family protein [Firmicutes bacterium]|nr:ADP-ribosylglycohydrolase family protein [Bacillota bacterium]
MKRTVDRFIGCLLGLAIGDALGSRLEGYAPEAVKRSKASMDEFLDELWQWSRGRWTDDTKMAVALAESIVESGGFNPEQAAKKYLEWYRSGDLRGIGNITRQSLANLERGSTWQESGIKADWAAGNGTAMRVAPIGLLDMNNIARLREDARNDAIITHNNHEAINGSIAVAYAIARIVKDDIDSTKLIYDVVDFIEPSDVLLRLEEAQKLFEQGSFADYALSELGTSGYVVETVASSFFCFISSPDNFEGAIYSAIRGGNDTDTIAAITGALSGAYLGFEGIPLKWREEVEDALKIEALATRIYEIATKTGS